MIDPKVPSSDYRELTVGLKWPQYSILILLCTGHMQLNQHLYNIGTTAMPIGPACNRKEETVQHYLLSCIAHEKKW